MRFRASFLILAALVLTAACVPTQRELRLERDLDEMKRRLAEVERKTAGLGQEWVGGTADRLAELGRRQAETQAGVDGLRVEQQSINGRMEDLAQANRQMQEDLALVRDEFGLKITALEDRLAALEKKGAGSRGPAAEGPQETPEALYERGVQLVMKQGDRTRAREVLQDFLRRYPGHELAANAIYWVGETYYGEKKYENAILQFQDVIQKYPGHPKAPAALLMQGLAFQALGDGKNARVILEKIVRDHPKSEEAKKARERLKAMK